MVESHIAKTLEDALKTLNSGKFRIVAGGTDMLIQNRSHTGMPIGYKDNVVYINLINELDYIKEDEDNVYIGATTRLETILKSENAPKILKNIIHEMAGPGIRHTATLAGNIANASPAGDSLVGLYVLDASIKCQSVDNTRIVKIKDFIQGVRKIDLKSNEMITEVMIPKYDFSRFVFKKVAPRLSDAISKLSFVGAIRIEDNEVKDLRMALGAVYMTVLRKEDIESKYIGQSIGELKNNIELIIEDYNSFIKPIDDQRSNKEYRKQVALNLIKDFIMKS
ncbi:MAG: FAD binding domain-containing protein [Tenericutes bacterium]|jgi:xanthine dehydrogenase FAD-binding subunit|nr:FAD binding domain-containing protein [Mycoplasmatota bacterium]